MSNLCVFYVYLLENLDYVAPIAGLHPMFYDVMNPYFDFQTLILLHYYTNQFAQRGQNGLRGGHHFCPPRLTGGRPPRPATEAPAAGKGFTAAGHLTCPPQEIDIYRGGRYEWPAAVNKINRGGPH